MTVIAIGHDPQPGEWELFGCPVVNVPIGRHSRGDIIHAVHRSVRIAGRRGVPDLAHGLWAGVTGLAAGLIGRRYRIPSVVSLCGGELAALGVIGYGGGLSRGGRVLARAALAVPTTTTAATEWVRQHAQRAGAAIDELVPLGADRARFTVGPSDEPSAHVVQVASLNRVKDQFLALDAFARVRAERPDATLTLAGVDTMGGAHAAHAATLGIAGSVRLLGFVPPDQLPELYRSATVHLNTSWHEAGPLAVVEAAMCGVPTVGTRVGHVADLAALDEPAAIAVGRDPAQVADGILRLLADPAQRARLGGRAAAWANAHDADHTAAAFGAIYRRLTARSSSTRAASSGEGPRPRR